MRLPDVRISSVVPEDEVWLVSIKNGEPVVHKIIGIAWEEETSPLDLIDRIK